MAERPSESTAKAIATARSQRRSNAAMARRQLKQQLKTCRGDATDLRAIAEASRDLRFWNHVMAATDSLWRLQDEPLEPRDIFLQALALRKLNRLDEAGSLLAAAVEVFPEDIGLVREQVRLCRAAQRWEELLNALDRLAEIGGDALDQTFVEYRLLALRHCGRSGEARSTIRGFEPIEEPETWRRQQLIEVAADGCCWFEAIEIADAIGTENHDAGITYELRILDWIEAMHGHGGSMRWDGTREQMTFEPLSALVEDPDSWISGQIDRAIATITSRSQLGTADELVAARLLVSQHRVETAINLLSKRRESLDRLNDHGELRAHHDLEFEHARLQFLSGGGPDHDDPLIVMEIDKPYQRFVSEGATVGFAHCRIGSQGLRVTGTVIDRSAHSVTLSIGEHEATSVPIETTGAFLITLHRRLIQDWSGEIPLRLKLNGSPVPDQASATVADTQVGDPGEMRSGFVDFVVRSGAPTLQPAPDERERTDGPLNKKGSARNAEQLTEGDVSSLLTSYRELRAFFEHELGRGLFITNDTLLGIVRDGEMTSHHESFNVAYLSPSKTPTAVRDDTAEVVHALAGAGFEVYVGRSVRVNATAAAGGSCPIDILPCWFEAGMFWGSSRPIEMRRSDLEPFREVRLGGVSLLAPRRAELFLERLFGPSWIHPDGRFQSRVASMDIEHQGHLDASLLTNTELTRITSRLLATGARPDRGDDRARSGRVISYFGQPLYPLESFVEYD